MTRKDYVLIASTLRTSWANNGFANARSYSDTCEEFAYKLQQDNPRFNRETFLAACGI